MHRTLKEDTASPPAPTLAIQRERFTAFKHCFNEQRPHQALGMQTPGLLYRPSTRPFPSSLDEIKYDERHIIRPVRKDGTIRWRSKEVFITEVLRRERVGLLPRLTNTLEIYFGELQLGLLDGETATFSPNPDCLVRPQVELLLDRSEEEVLSG